MKAVIFAGSEGEGLKPITCNRPKAMVMVMNKPIMEYVLDTLKNCNIKEVAVVLGYMPSLVRDYFGNGRDFGMNITYFSDEDEKQDIIESLKAFTDEPFVALNGDSLTDMDLNKAISFHKKKKAELTAVLSVGEVNYEHGVAITDENSRVVDFTEKPSWSSAVTDTVNTEIYIIEPEILNTISNHREILKDAIGKKLNIYGYATKEYWCDVNDLASYRQCHFDIFNNCTRLKIKGKKKDNSIFMEKGAEIDAGALIVPPVYIGKNVIVGKYARVESFSVLGDFTVVGAHSKTNRCILYDNVKVGRFCEIKGSVVCSNARIKERSFVFEQAIIGDNTILGESCLVKPSIKIWPYKEIESDTTVSFNLVWDNKRRKSYIENGCILDDMTPEFGVRIGRSVCKCFDSGRRIGIAGDGSNCAEMIKNSIVTGIQAEGGVPYDIGCQIMPVLRHEIREKGLSGGIMVEQKKDTDIVSVSVIDQKGDNIGSRHEKALGVLLEKDDLTGGGTENIGEVVRILDAEDRYVADMKKIAEGIKDKYRVCVKMPDKHSTLIMDEIFKNTKIEMVYEWDGEKNDDYDIKVDFSENYEKPKVLEWARAKTDDDLQSLVYILSGNKKDSEIEEN